MQKTICFFMASTVVLSFLTGCQPTKEKMGRTMEKLVSISSVSGEIPVNHVGFKGNIHTTWKGEPVSLRYEAVDDGKNVTVSYYHGNRFLRRVRYGETPQCLSDVEDGSYMGVADWSWRLSPESGFYFLWLARKDKGMKDFFVNEDTKGRYARRLFRDVSFSGKTERGRLICDVEGRPRRWVVESGWGLRFEKDSVGLYDSEGKKRYLVTVTR